MPPLSGCISTRLEGEAWASCSRVLLLPHARSVVFVSFGPFRITTVQLRDQAKGGHACRQGPQTLPVGHLSSLLLRALNGTRMRENAVPTRLDVPFNLAVDGVP